MEEQQDYTAFTKGYNDGYLLSKYEPALLKEVMKTPQQDNPQFEGMLSGQRAQERKQFLDNVQNIRMLQEQRKNLPKL